MSGIFDLFKNNDCSCNSRGKGIKLDPVTIIICNLCKKRSELKKTLKINKTSLEQTIIIQQLICQGY